MATGQLLKKDLSISVFGNDLGDLHFFIGLFNSTLNSFTPLTYGKEMFILKSYVISKQAFFHPCTKFYRITFSLCFLCEVAY